ncbi:uncharacterized protein LOC114120276 [Aphis gossypii]|uniref:C2H2-type domain-containing protein n=1 Tax=Aphis gossypii TaxID=80765 RepID=A0A9P0J4D8_APHGO|nr:uncharacterized protein LOC114120276 [Aphis gossypii]CAH1726706.1 unnamed protein product [Aphis gossypii]
MAFCFICDAKLFGERTRVCSSISPHSNSPYPEKIGEVLGEEFVIIVTPADHMCKKCTSLLNHVDKLENDLKLVKNALVTNIQKKYGLVPADQPVKSVNIVNGHLRTDDLEVGQRKVPSGLTVREPSSSSTPLKTKHDPSKMKIYKCGFCTFQSKDLGHVRFHMRSHMNKKKDGENSNQTAMTKTVTQQQQQQQQREQQQLLPPQPKKRLYRCQVCSTSYDSRFDCLEHIQKDHNQQPSSTTAEEKESGGTTVNIPVFQTDAVNSIDNQQAVVKNDVENHVVNKESMDTNMLLNDNIPADDSTVNKQEETQNTCENMSGQNELMQVSQDMPVTNVDMSDMTIEGGETGTDHLDIESMLAAIHNDVVSSPNDGRDTQI